jgi:hypothetical protein
MASCAYCCSFVFFGGKKQDGLVFCNTNCQERGFLTRIAESIPDDQVESFVQEVHNGPCPNCDGRGPIDLYTSYRVYSALFLTQWYSRPLVCCRSCGVKNAIGSTFYSAILGWWGIPWGLLVTPIQVIRNMISLVSAPDPTRPSPAFKHILRLQLAASLVEG